MLSQDEATSVQQQDKVSSIHCSKVATSMGGGSDILITQQELDTLLLNVLLTLKLAEVQEVLRIVMELLE
jgi:hypothetical protein